MFTNRYQFLKLVQNHGNIEKFDLLFHRSGPQAGLPRGYAFVTYKSSRDAERAMEALQNLKVGSKAIVVRYAHSINEVCNFIKLNSFFITFYYYM
jgi:RNA recognition motif-containing protein